MPSQRDPNKKLVGFFANEDEARALLEAAETEGLSVADLLRKWIKEATAKQKSAKKTRPKP